MKPILYGSGAAILVAGAVAFALSLDGRTADLPEPEAVAKQEAAPEPAAELVDPGTIEEPVAEPDVALPEGYEVDEDGHVWEPLSYHKPQLKNNGDGTVTMRKLARIIEADGSMREVPIKVVAHPISKRMPVKKRPLPAWAQPAQPDGDAAQEQQDESQDG